MPANEFDQIREWLLAKFTSHRDIKEGRYTIPVNGLDHEVEVVYPGLIHVLGLTSPTTSIAARMSALILRLQTAGVKGETFPDIEKECEEDWTEDYAIACNFSYYDGYEDKGEYFDQAQLYYDLEQEIRKTFADDPTIKIGLYGFPHDTAEVEAYRE